MRTVCNTHTRNPPICNFFTIVYKNAATRVTVTKTMGILQTNAPLALLLRKEEPVGLVGTGVTVGYPVGGSEAISEGTIDGEADTVGVWEEVVVGAREATAEGAADGWSVASARQAFASHDTQAGANA